MGMNVGGKKGGMNAEINVTPLVDIILVLLIIFMIAAPAFKPAFQVTLPKATKNKPLSADKKVLIVSIHKDGRVALGEDTYFDPKDQAKNWVVLSERLKVEAQNMLAKGLDLEADVEADRQISYQQLIKVLDTVRNADFKTLLRYDPVDKAKSPVGMLTGAGASAPTAP